LLDDLLLDINSGHNIVATVFVQASSMYRDQGPVEMRPVGEVEFVNGVAAMSASGTYGKTKVAAAWLQRHGLDRNERDTAKVCKFREGQPRGQPSP
jgi:hypothetical protein